MKLLLLTGQFKRTMIPASMLFTFMMALFLVSAPARCDNPPESPDDLEAFLPTYDYSVGEKILSFNGETLDGKPFTAHEYLGKKVLVLAFWLQNCDLCMTELSDLRDAITRNKLEDKVAVLTIARAKDEFEIDALKSAASAAKMKFPIIKDPKLLISRSFNVTMVPSFVIIDKNSVLSTRPIFHIKTPVRDMTFEEMLLRVVKGEDIPPIQFSRATDNDVENKLIGTQLPDFSLSGLDSKKYALKDLLGKKKIVLVFWHPDSKVCETPMREIRDFTAANGEKLDFSVFSFVSLFGDKQVKNAINFIVSENITFPVLVDNGSKVGLEYGVKTIPTAFVAGPDGKIINVITGDKTDFAAEIEAALKSTK